MTGYSFETFVDWQLELHRPSRHPRERRRNRLRFDVKFAAVTAAHVRHDHAYATQRQTKDSREMIAQSERVLAGRPNCQFFTVVVSDIVVRLERVVLNFLKTERIFKNVIGFSKAFIDIFPAKRQVIANIRAVESFRRAVNRAAQLGPSHSGFVNQYGARCRRVLDIGHFRELFVLDVNELQRLLGRWGIIGKHRGDRIADIAHFVDCDNGLIFIGRAVLVIEGLNIVARQRRDHPGKFFRLRGIDLDELRVSDGAAQYPRMRHARKLDIARVDRLAGDFFDAVDSGRIGSRDRINVLLFHAWNKYTATAKSCRAR